MKTTINKKDYMHILALVYMAKSYTKKINDVIKQLDELLEVESGEYTDHLQDMMYNDDISNVEKDLMKHLGVQGIKVKK
jgi:hypothetical protein